MKEEIISVIVPIYNAEKYIYECLNSLTDQTSNSYEILLIDDGSTDNSFEICKNYAEKFKNIRVLHKNNGGVSAARNYGLEHASGEIITFVDADDFVDREFIETIEETIDNHDILIFDLSIYRNRTDECNAFFQGDRRFYGRESIEDLVCQAISFKFGKGYTPKHHGVGCATCKAYKKKIVEKIRFNESQRMSEDSVFNVRCFLASNDILYINKALYHYRVDNASACRSYDENAIRTNEIMIKAFQDSLREFSCESEKVEKALEHRELQNILSMVKNYTYGIGKYRELKLKYIAISDINWAREVLDHYKEPDLGATCMDIAFCKMLRNKQFLCLKYTVLLERNLRTIAKKIKKKSS